MSQATLTNEILLERDRQDAMWRGTFNDDDWDALDWHEMIADYNAWARRRMTQGKHDEALQRYIQVAALALAAAEALERKVVV